MLKYMHATYGPGLVVPYCCRGWGDTLSCISAYKRCDGRDLAIRIEIRKELGWHMCSYSDEDVLFHEREFFFQSLILQEPDVVITATKGFAMIYLSFSHTSPRDYLDSACFEIRRCSYLQDSSVALVEAPLLLLEDIDMQAEDKVRP